MLHRLIAMLAFVIGNCIALSTMFVLRLDAQVWQRAEPILRSANATSPDVFFSDVMAPSRRKMGTEIAVYVNDPAITLVQMFVTYGGTCDGMDCYTSTVASAAVGSQVDQFGNSVSWNGKPARLAKILLPDVPANRLAGFLIREFGGFREPTITTDGWRARVVSAPTANPPIISIGRYLPAGATKWQVHADAIIREPSIVVTNFTVSFTTLCGNVTCVQTTSEPALVWEGAAHSYDKAETIRMASIFVPGASTDADVLDVRVEEGTIAKRNVVYRPPKPFEIGLDSGR